MNALTTLQKATLKQLTNSSRLTQETRDTLQDIANHGASAGFSGFIYYVDTVAFFKRQRQNIVAMVKEYAAEYGHNPIDFVASFNCLDRDDETIAEIARALYGHMSKDDYLVANALAWFALEETARQLTEE